MAIPRIIRPRNILGIQRSGRSMKARRICSFRRSPNTCCVEVGRRTKDMKKLRVLYHDNCFDGVSSAAVFSRFYKGHIDLAADIEYEGLTHKAGQHIADEQFGEDENAIVDFKYS